MTERTDDLTEQRDDASTTGQRTLTPKQSDVPAQRGPDDLPDTTPSKASASPESYRKRIRRRFNRWGNLAAILIAILSLIATGLQSYYSQSQVAVAQDQLAAEREQLAAERTQFLQEGPEFDVISRLDVNFPDPNQSYSAPDGSTIGIEPATPERSNFSVAVTNSGRSPGSVRDVGLELYSGYFLYARNRQRDNYVVYCRQGGGDYTDCVRVLPARLEPGESMEISFAMAVPYRLMRQYGTASGGIDLMIDAPGLPESPIMHRSTIRVN